MDRDSRTARGGSCALFLPEICPELGGTAVVKRVSRASRRNLGNALSRFLSLAKISLDGKFSLSAWVCAEHSLGLTGAAGNVVAGYEELPPGASATGGINYSNDCPVYSASKPGPIRTRKRL